MITRTLDGKHISIPLTQEEKNAIYDVQKRIYWETDFISRCIDRSLNETGLCNLSHEILSENELLLTMAYEMYQKKQDCNVAYNDTLDQIIDLLEEQFANGVLPSSKEGPE